MKLIKLKTILKPKLKKKINAVKKINKDIVFFDVADNYLLL